jgi:predicted nucleic acid-binding protein
VIVLDTNILSVLVTPDHPDLDIVQAWQRTSVDQDFRLNAVSLAEIAFGIAILPEGARKRRLHDAAQDFIAATANTTLPFGVQAAAAYGTIMALRRAQGHPMSQFDAQIAAVAHVAKAVIATRNTRDFEGCGVPIVNPYLDP